MLEIRIALIMGFILGGFCGTVAGIWLKNQSNEGINQAYCSAVNGLYVNGKCIEYKEVSND